jgi:hypothetical protein
MPPDRSAFSDKGCLPAEFLGRTFNDGYARRQLKTFRKEGLGERAQILIDYLVSVGIEGRSVLEIGAGIGTLNLELVRRGASHAISIDAASSNALVATELATEMDLQDRSEQRVGDFVEIADEIESSDIVLLDRVVCCYPHMEALGGAAGERAKAYCGLTYPRWTWWGRVGLRLINAVQFVRRDPFRIHMHDPVEIERTLNEKGLTLAFEARAGLWEVALYERITP